MTYVAVYAIPAIFALVGWMLLRDLDRWLDHWRASERELRDYGVGPARPGSIDATLTDIRGLPEVPFDWDREEAV